MNYPVLNITATGNRIKELRKKNHLKVEDISNFMGFESPQAVYKWQSGKSMPTIDNLFALSALFRVPGDEILVGEKEIREEIICER